MRFVNRWALVTFSYFAWSGLFAKALKFYGLPTSPIDWPVSIALLSLLPISLFLAHNHRQPLKALIVCSVVSLSGAFCFFISNNLGFNQLVYTFSCVGAGLACLFMYKQKLMAIMCASMVVLGMIMVYKIGTTIPPGEYVLWVFVRNALYVALVSAPIARIWTDHAPKEEKTFETSREQHAQERQKAA